MSDKRTDKLLEKADKVHKKELDSHTIKYIRNKKREELKPLTLFETRLKCCKEYNEKSFEARRLRKEIWLYKEEIQEITNAINDEEAYLKKYIAEKENLYTRIRAKRSN